MIPCPQPTPCFVRRRRQITFPKAIRSSYMSIRASYEQPQRHLGRCMQTRLASLTVSMRAIVLRRRPSDEFTKRNLAKD